MSAEAFLILLVLAYPVMVLVIAITGPHNPVERAEYERFKIERRQRRRSGRDV